MVELANDEERTHWTNDDYRDRERRNQTAEADSVEDTIDSGNRSDRDNTSQGAADELLERVEEAAAVKAVAGEEGVDAVGSEDLSTC